MLNEKDVDDTARLISLHVMYKIKKVIERRNQYEGTILMKWRS